MDKFVIKYETKRQKLAVEQENRMQANVFPNVAIGPKKVVENQGN